jgi:hypothetical protein
LGVFNEGNYSIEAFVIDTGVARKRLRRPRAQKPAKFNSFGWFS